MARLTVNIGVAGNDATGDSVRESFRKVNENFREIYDIFSEGGLNNVTGIKFAGPIGDATNVRVTKFSNTAYFTTQLNEPQIVPTETAIENYITRRLGLDQRGNAIENADSIETLVPIQTGVNGFMDRDGRLPYLGGVANPFNVNSSKIVNVLQPTLPTDASTKNYVDNRIWFNDDEILVIDNGDNATISVELNTVPLAKIEKIPPYNVLMNNTSSSDAVTGVSVQDMLDSAFAVSGEVDEKVLVWNNGFTYSATSNGNVADSYVKVSATNTVSFNQINSPSLSDVNTISTVDNLLAVEMYSDSTMPVVVMHGAWELAANSTLESTYADLAEFYEADSNYEPGTVLVFGGEKEVTLGNKMGDHRVAGVVTTDPAYIMNKKCPGKKACIALQGRVPVLIVGRAKKGDILISAARPGYAVVCNTPSPGTVIGKCLEDKISDAPGLIEVAVGRF